MRRSSRYSNENELFSMVSRLLERELCAVSDYLYFSAVCERDYPELSEVFDGFGRERADNIKSIEKALAEPKLNYVKNFRIKTSTLTSDNIFYIIKELIERESEDVILYERLYLVDKEDRFEALIKEILRASKKRLSILENILKT